MQMPGSVLNWREVTKLTYLSTYLLLSYFMKRWMIKSNLSQYRNRSTAYQYWQYEINWVLCLSRAINSSPMTQTRRPITKIVFFSLLTSNDQIQFIPISKSIYSIPIWNKLGMFKSREIQLVANDANQTSDNKNRLLFHAMGTFATKKINLPIHKQLSKIFTCSLCIFNKVKLFYKKIMLCRLL